MERSARQRLVELCEKYQLYAQAEHKLEQLLTLLKNDRLAATTVKDPTEAVDVHIADSLAALNLEEIREAKTVVDLGSGAGIPVVPLAIALPSTSFEAIESNGKKCDFVRKTAETLNVQNLAVTHARAEERGREEKKVDAVTARAVAPLNVLLEYAAPLLQIGGRLVAWKGRVERGEGRDASRAAEAMRMTLDRVVEAAPYAGSRHHTFHIYRKNEATPARFPRRSGMARKRPI